MSTINQENTRISHWNQTPAEAYMWVVACQYVEPAKVSW